MKNVLLINPGWAGLVSRRGQRFNRAWPPLSLMVCASILRNQGLEVRILDERVQASPSRILEEARNRDSWVVLTSSPLDRWQCPNLEVDYFVDLARSFPPDRLIITGVHGTIYPMEMLRRTGARAIVIGEPETVLARLMGQEDWSEIAGIAFRENNKEILNPRAAPPDLSLFPVPAYDLVDWSRYRYEILGRRFALFEGSRGCPYRCSFCLKAMYPSGVRYKPIDRLFDEIDQAVRKFGVESGYIFDLEFTLDRNRTMEICDRFIHERFPFVWCCQTRADAVDPELLSKMRKAGCRLIHFGVESGSERVLSAMRKGTTLELIERGISYALESGIQVACFFMFGFPGETREEMQKTLSFAKKLNPAFASFHSVTPYPTTPLFRSLSFKPGDAGRSFSFPFCCSGHGEDLLDSMVHRAFRQFYLRPGYILSRLRRSEVRQLISQLRLFGGFAG